MGRELHVQLGDDSGDWEHSGGAVDQVVVGRVGEVLVLPVSFRAVRMSWHDDGIKRSACSGKVNGGVEGVKLCFEESRAFVGESPVFGSGDFGSVVRKEVAETRFS